MMITSDTLKRFAPKVIDAERPAIAPKTHGSRAL